MYIVYTCIQIYTYLYTYIHIYVYTFVGRFGGANIIIISSASSSAFICRVSPFSDADTSDTSRASTMTFFFSFSCVEKLAGARRCLFAASPRSISREISSGTDEDASDSALVGLAAGKNSRKVSSISSFYNKLNSEVIFWLCTCLSSCAQKSSKKSDLSLIFMPDLTVR